MRGVLSLVCMAVVLCTPVKCPAASAAPGNAVYKPEAEAASIEKTITNLVNALESTSRAPVSTKTSHSKWIFGGIGLLAGLFMVQRLVPKIAPLLKSADPVAEAQAETLQAEEQSFSRFAETFSTGPLPRSHNPGFRSESIPMPQPDEQKPEPKTPLDPLTEFLRNARNDLAAMGNLLSRINRAADETSRQKIVRELSQLMAAFKQTANIPAMVPVWQVACALEALLNQLIDRPAHVTSSTLRTVANALDLLNALCIRDLKPDLATEPPVRLLAVDDDAICRHAISFALKKVFNQPDLAVDGKAALVLAEKEAYDIIFLDIEMPGMDGFELCSKIHETTTNARTPVVFVTRHSDFDARAKSSLIGGNDLIGKPFLIFEVAVKALTLVLRTRLQPDSQSKPVTPRANVKAKLEQTDPAMSVFAAARSPDCCTAAN